MAEKLTIANWAEEDKPREKLERLGASALSNAELLGILIGSGSTDESAVDLMKRILKDCDNNLNQLGKKSIRELTQYKGMGPAKAITILAACELGKRRALDKIGTRPDLGSSLAIYNYIEDAGFRYRGSMAPDDEPELQAHQSELHLKRRHYRNGNRHPAHHKRSGAQQRYYYRLLPQSSQQQSSAKQSR